MSTRRALPKSLKFKAKKQNSTPSRPSRYPQKRPTPSSGLSTVVQFPEIWTQVVDEVIPPFVKKHFSPHETWAKKPFGIEDAKFFSKGLTELSGFFSEHRERAKLPNYFTTGKFRSSYFLYFFPLQASKFLALFKKHPKAFQSILDFAFEKNVLRIVDLGAGPGTASIAFLVHFLDWFLKQKKPKAILPFKIELIWVDHNKTIMEEGKKLLFDILPLIPELEGDIQVDLQVRNWWDHPDSLIPNTALFLFGNVLNESSFDPKIFQSGIGKLSEKIKGTGASVLFVEPAFKSSSQRLGKIRNELLELNPKISIWGPCMHLLACPLAEGRDWCHFSVPAELPGVWFRRLSIHLGSVREWIKFSYLWLSEKAETESGFRVVSDPLRKGPQYSSQVCMPEQVGWTKSSIKPKFFRGEIISHDSILQPKNKKD